MRVQEPGVIKNVGDYKEKKEYQSYHKYNHKKVLKIQAEIINESYERDTIS